jgi:hypothetical protein
MADERDRLRKQLGLAPLPTISRTDSAASVDERTQARAKTLTADQLEARQAQNTAATDLAAAKKANEDLAKKLGAKIDTTTGKIDKTTIPKIQGNGKTVTGVTYEGTGKSRIKVTKYSDGTETRESAPEDVGGGGKTFTASDGTVFTDQNAYVTYENNLRTKKLAADSAAAAATAERKSAYDLLYSQFAKYGLQSLVAPLEGLIKEGVPASEFAIRLRETDGYKQRFAANQARIKKGLSALSEAEYIGLEDAYQGIMRQYGMPESYYTRGELGRQEGFEKFIGGDVSPAELETRISTAYNRVINANPEVVQALKQFYPNITNGDILSYALDPEKALTDINKKVTAAEIGAGAMQAGLTTGLARAEELQRYGVTKETAQQGFGTIASGLERGRQLSNIYQQPTYTQEVAETEVFALPDAEKARRQRRRLGQLETATFSGSTGMTGGALDRERAGQY